MSQLTTPAAQPDPIHVGQRIVIPLVETVGPALPAHATYPQLDASELTALLDAYGDTYTDPSRTHLRMASQGFAILGAGRTIIVDTCLGGPKPARPHPRPGFASHWLSTLAAAGISPDDVDTVINTHLHHDHVGWNTVLGGGGLRPTFPNARYLLAEPEYVFATAATPQLHIADSVLPLQHAGQLDLIASDTRIDGNVRVIPAPGHTPGHIIVEISSQGHTTVLAGDLIHHPLQLRHPQISSAMCVDPATSAASRQQILDQYADTGTYFLPAHLPVGGHLTRKGSGYTLTPLASRGHPDVQQL